MANGYINGLDFTIKNNNIPQTCFYCEQAIVKGNFRVKMIDGAYFNHPTYSYYHLSCFKEGIAKFFKKEVKQHA